MSAAALEPSPTGAPAASGDGASVSTRVRLRSDRGHVIPLHVDRWFAEPSAAERQVLARCLPPVLDVGCGPARHTLALLAAGIPALGVDISAGAVNEARRRGAPVLHRSVFDRLPEERRWGAVLLLDGDVGIGGDPSALLARARSLLRTGGRALVEVDPPGTPTESLRVRFEGDVQSHRWFPWARVGVEGLEDIVISSGLRVAELWTAEGRWFGRLEG